MPQLKLNTFSEYDFSNEELDEALLLPPLLRMYLQSRMAMIAQEKLSAKFDPLNPVRFAQVEAELAGKISILDELLEGSSVILEKKKTRVIRL